MRTFAEISSDWRRLAQIRTGWLTLAKLAQIGPGWLQIGAGWLRLAQVGPDLHSLAQDGSDLRTLAQAGPGWRRLAQVGTCWRAPAHISRGRRLARGGADLRGLAHVGRLGHVGTCSPRSAQIGANWQILAQIGSSWHGFGRDWLRPLAFSWKILQLPLRGSWDVLGSHFVNKSDSPKPKNLRFGVIHSKCSAKQRGAQAALSI